ncbi:MAG: methyltransferase domain-containing protein, partial [Ignavibacteriaceae bacterium]|nr:methyltransferase domain-containing protein [Ignavibacteriaceae bacterium]
MKIPILPEDLLNQVNPAKLETMWFTALAKLFTDNVVLSFEEATQLAQLGLSMGIARDPLFYKIEEIIKLQNINSLFVKNFLNERELSPWSLAPGTLEFLDNFITDAGNVLEFGSGLSTEFLALKLSQQSKSNRIISFEQDEKYALEANKNLEQLGLSKYAKILYAPLVQVNYNGRRFDVYDIRKHYNYLENFKADFVLVDGPSGGGYNRWGSILIASNFVNENAAWMLDDAVRDDELKVAAECKKYGINIDSVLFKGKGITEGKISTSLVSLDNLYHSIEKIEISGEQNFAGCTWEQIQKLPELKLYAGDIPAREEYNGLIGLSITKNDSRHILHDITKPLPLEDGCASSFQSEDVFEHIPYKSLNFIINEIYRVLKPGGLLRLSLPDYGCDILQNRSLKNSSGAVVFDPGGGGTIENPGHVWFPTKDNLTRLLETTNFGMNGEIKYLQFYNADGSYNLNEIDYSKGFVMRTPDNDTRVQNPRRPMSLVVDLIKPESVLKLPHAALQNIAPKISFVMIVLNGMPFIEYALKAIYQAAHQIIIVEGAVEKCLFAASLTGSSTDGT